jgi:hypothetical protein
MALYEGVDWCRPRFAAANERVEAAFLRQLMFEPRAPTTREGVQGGEAKALSEAETRSAWRAATGAALKILFSNKKEVAAEGPGAQAAQLDELLKYGDIIVAVDLLLVVPPGRYCHNFDFFRNELFDPNAVVADTEVSEATAQSASGEGVTSGEGGKAAAAVESAPKPDNVPPLPVVDGAARLFALLTENGAVFRFLRWLVRRRRGAQNRVDPAAVPLHMLRLPGDFMSRPPRYVKRVYMVLDPTVKRWRVHGVMPLGNFMAPFSIAAWKEHGGWTAESMTQTHTKQK